MLARYLALRQDLDRHHTRRRGGASAAAADVDRSGGGSGGGDSTVCASRDCKASAPAPGTAPPPPPAANAKAARQLNRLLSQLAKRKQLSTCRSTFAAGAAAGTVDAWSHAILINAYANCGDGAGALKALGEMRACGHRPCVFSYTAALKAPCGEGNLEAASALLGEMEADFAGAAAEEAPAGAGRTDGGAVGRASGGGGSAVAGGDFMPSVRTANTYFRGCLVRGGAAEARALLGRLGRDGVWRAVSPDASSHEYVGTLCAQALHLDEAARLADAAAEAGGGQEGCAGARAAARVRLALCRSAALLGAWRRCRREAAAARQMLALCAEEERGGEAAAGRERPGGRSPKQRQGGGGGGGEDDGLDRHATFRRHQRDEALGASRAPPCSRRTGRPVHAL